MAKILLLDRSQYVEGSVRLYRGDRWNLACRAVNRLAGVDQPVDITGASITGFFPAATGCEGVVAVSGTPTDPTNGEFNVPVSEDVTPLVSEMPIGFSFYAVIDSLPASGSPFTAQTLNPDLEILDREFQQF